MPIIIHTDRVRDSGRQRDLLLLVAKTIYAVVLRTESWVGQMGMYEELEELWRFCSVKQKMILSQNGDVLATSLQKHDPLNLRLH